MSRASENSYSSEYETDCTVNEDGLLTIESTKTEKLYQHLEHVNVPQNKKKGPGRPPKKGKIIKNGKTSTRSEKILAPGLRTGPGNVENSDQSIAALLRDLTIEVLWP